MTGRRRLRLLLICPYAVYPPVGGGKLRIFHLARQWLALGHSVELWIVPPDEPTPTWPDGTQPSRLVAFEGRHRGSLAGKVASLVSPLPEEVWLRPAPDLDDVELFDVVLLMQAHVGQFADPFIERGVPVVLDQQNVEADIARVLTRLAPTRLGRLRFWLDVRKWRRYERDLIRRTQLTVGVSEADARAFQDLVPSAHIHMHPNGADLETLGYRDHAPNRRDRLIMTGTLGYLPNLDAATWFVDRILPLVRRRRPGVKLVLVGASPPASIRRLASDDVEILGRVPDVRPLLDDADLFVAPLREGGGSRLKLLEAFAVGLPTVATTAASAGIEVRPGTDLAIADDEATFADEVVRLLEDEGARGAMAQAARRLVERSYDWRSIALAYERDLLELAGASGASGVAGARDGPTRRSNSAS